jgi:hypothetical protein
MEEDLEDSQDFEEFSADEKDKLKRRLEDQINRIQDDFDDKIKQVFRKQNRYIEEFNNMGASKNQNTLMEEYRRRVRENPGDLDALRKLGREYHRNLQDSNVHNVDRRKIYQKYKDDMDKDFGLFLKDMKQLMDELEKKGRYQGIGARQERESDLVESEVRNSTIPKEWEPEDPMEDVNKSLHMIRQNKERKYREE